MDYRPYIFISALVLTLSAGFLIGFHSTPKPEPQFAFNWSVPTGPEAYPVRARGI